MADLSPSTRSSRQAIACCSAAAALCFPGAVHAQARWAIQTSASAGVETSPYQGQGSSNTALTGTLDLQPYITIDRPLTSLQLSGDAQVTFYDHGLPANENLSLNASGTHKLSAHTTLSAQLGFTDNIAGGINYGRVPLLDPFAVATLPPGGQAATDSTAATALPVVTDLPLTGLPAYLNDPSLGAYGRRRQTYQLGSSLTTLISARDSLSGGISASLNRYDGPGLQEFNYASPSLSWQRALGERFSIGANFQVGFIDYLHTRIGDGTTYTPQVTATRGLGRGWTLAGSIGVTIASLRGIAGDTRTTQSLSGSFDLCQQGTRRNICLIASRQVAPSAFEGVTTSTIVSGSYSYRLTELSGVQLSGSYSHADNPLQPGLVGFGDASSDYGSATGSYSRQLGRALSGFISAGYAQAFGNRTARGANITAQVGVSYRFTPRR